MFLNAIRHAMLFHSLIVTAFDLLAVTIIVLGTLYAFGIYFGGIIGVTRCRSIDFVQVKVSRSILFALEFLLAADVIETIITPDYYTIGMLGILLVIRVILGYYLNLELMTIKKRQKMVPEIL